MTLLTIGKSNPTLSDTFNGKNVFLIIYAILLLMGTFGNLLLSAAYGIQINFKKQPVFICFIILPLIHTTLLWMSYPDFIEIEFLSEIYYKHEIACSLFNVIYRSLVFIQSW